MNFVDKDGTTKVYVPVHPWNIENVILLLEAETKSRAFRIQTVLADITCKITSATVFEGAEWSICQINSCFIKKLTNPVIIVRVVYSECSFVRLIYYVLCLTSYLLNVRILYTNKHLHANLIFQH